MSDETSAQMANDPTLRELRWFEWCGIIVPVIYFIFMGVFAIEEINARETALKLLSARQTEVLTRLAEERRNSGLRADRTKLQDLQTRLEILTMHGTAALGERGTLRSILCDLDSISDTSGLCKEPEKLSWIRWAVLRGTTSSTGTVLAGLIVTAAFGGALIRLSLDSKRRDFWRTLLRALGGGVVCYFVVTGGGTPLAAVELGKSASPATASLFGLISGMFSSSVFKLVSDFVDAFVRKLTPAAPCGK